MSPTASTRICAAHKCFRPAHVDRMICDQCAWELERDLGDVTALVEELNTSRARQTAGSTRDAGGTGAALPFDPRAADALHELSAVLVSWAPRVLGHRCSTPAWSPTAVLARWLLAERQALLNHVEAGAAVDEICGAVRLAWRAVDAPIDRLYAGLCRARLDSDELCASPVYAILGRPHAVCPLCRTTHDAKARRDAMRADLDQRLLTAAEIAMLASYFGELTNRERTRKLLNKWVERGVIAPHGLTLGGDPTFPFGQTLGRLLAAREKTTPHVSRTSRTPLNAASPLPHQGHAPGR